ncbi:hypothetical protein J437_LFUL001297, partial [Ladona fulva]
METMTSMSEVRWITGKEEKHSRIEDEYILGDIIGRPLRGKVVGKINVSCPRGLTNCFLLIFRGEQLRLSTAAFTGAGRNGPAKPFG